VFEIGLEEGFTSDNTILISQFVDQLLNKLEEININD
jgi:hypothetical protein